MKNLFTCFLVLLVNSYSLSQTSFIIDDIQGAGISHFCEATFHEGRYYLLSNNVQASEEQRLSSNLHLYSETGAFIWHYNLGGFEHQYFKIISIDGDELILAGSREREDCSAELLISRFNTTTLALDHLAQHDFCLGDKYVRAMRIVNGLNGELFIEGDYGYKVSTSPHNRNFVFHVDTAYQLTEIFDDIGYHFSVDFSRKGYVLKDTYVCDFYDRQFNARKQRINFLDGYANSGADYQVPFGHHYILDHVMKNQADAAGTALRVVDSNLYILKEAIISPSPGYSNKPSIPDLGGFDIVNNETVWTATNFGYSLHADSSYFSISKLDIDLNIICNHFIGFDKVYRIYGIEALEEGGAIAYGFHSPYNGEQWTGSEDVFACKVDDNCGLTTSSKDLNHPTYSISAYPNPSINSLSFDINGFDEALLSVEIYQANGAILFSQRDLSGEVIVKDLPAGQYFYRIKNGKDILGAGSWMKAD